MNLPRVLLAAVVIALLGRGAAAQDEAGRPRLVAQLGHSMLSAALSPDGEQVVTGDDDGTSSLWDASSGDEIRRFVGHTDSVWSVAFSPDGRSVLTGSSDKTARLWDTSSGREVRRFVGHTGMVMSVAFSRDGRCVLTGSFDKTARLWDIGSGKEVRRFEGHTGEINSAAISADGRYVLTGSSDNAARLWEISSGDEIRRFVGHSGLVWSVAFSPDGRSVLTGSYDHTARLWDASSGKELRRFVGHTSVLDSVALSPDGRSVLTGSGDGTARLWDASSGKELRRFVGHTNAVLSLAFSTDGQSVLTGSTDGTARLWDASSGKEIRRYEGHTETVNSAAFSPDGRSILTVSSDNTMRLWDTSSGEEIRRFEGHSDFVSSVAFSPDGRSVFTGSDDRTARLWDIGSGKEVRRFIGQDCVRSVAFSPDGRSVVTGSDDGTARLWDASSGGEILQFEKRPKQVFSAAFSPDGRSVLAGSNDGTAWLWDTSSGKEVRRFVGHTDSVWSVAFSPDGRSVLTGSSDKTARLWDTSSGREVRHFVGHTGMVMSVAFSRDGRYVLTGSFDKTARLWDIGSGKEVRRFEGHTGTINSADFSPDGQSALTGSSDGTARLWNAATGAELCALISFRDGSWAVVAPDGRFDCASLEQVEGLHWVMPDDPMTPVPIEVFMRDYYEPRLLPRLLAGEVMAPVPPLVGLNRVQPLVKVASVEAQGEDEVNVTVEVESAERTYGGKTRKSGAQDLQLFRDGRLVAHRDGALALDEHDRAAVVFRGIRLPRDGRREVGFSAYAFNADRVKSETHRVAHALPPLEPRKGVAYVVCFGVDVFADPKWNLGYAVADARAVAESLKGRLSGYERVVPMLLTSTKEDDHARKGDIETVLRLLAGRTVAEEGRQRVPGADEVQRARPEDLVVISVSTHGATDAKGQFHLVPSDVSKGEDWLASCISADDLTDWLRDVDAGEMAMIVDACHSAASVDAEGFKPGPMGSRGLGQLAYSKRMRVLAASQASDVALESRVVRHGLLTYALTTDGLAKGRADFDPQDGKITLAEWFRYGEKRVPALAEEVAEGKVRAVGEKGLDIDRKRRIAQQPSLFDFARETDDVVLAAR